MSENTKIEWCDHTFNPWEGCQKIGPGCDHCYAETRNARFGGGQAINWGAGAPRRRTSAGNWRKPVAWQANAAAFMAEHGHRQRVFCASLADVFDNAVPSEWRDDLWELIYSTPDLDWLLLTKRIGNVKGMLPVRGKLPSNVWLGATITSQAEADRDIPKLAVVPARVRFLSMEPLLGPVDLRLVRKTWAPGRCNHCCNGDRCDDRSHYDRKCCPHCRGTGGQPVDWVIVGGESGPGARPMHLDWARSLRDQCRAAGVPFLFKQWGEWHPIDSGHSGMVGAWSGEIFMPGWGDIETRSNNMVRAGKSAFGHRLLDGAEHNRFPGGAA
jgi:protein gp37